MLPPYAPLLLPHFFPLSPLTSGPDVVVSVDLQRFAQLGSLIPIVFLFVLLFFLFPPFFPFTFRPRCECLASITAIVRFHSFLLILDRVFFFK